MLPNIESCIVLCMHALKAAVRECEGLTLWTTLPSLLRAALCAELPLFFGAVSIWVVLTLFRKISLNSILLGGRGHLLPFFSRKKVFSANLTGVRGRWKV